MNCELFEKVQTWFLPLNSMGGVSACEIDCVNFTKFLIGCESYFTSYYQDYPLGWKTNWSNLSHCILC